MLKDLEAEKARWQATVESMLDLLTTCDADGRATYMNAAYSRLVERSIQPGLDLEAHPDYYQLYRPDGTLFDPRELPLQRAALEGVEVRNVEIVQRAPSGREFIAIFSAAPLLDAEGRVTGAVAVGHDITEQRRAERGREQLLAQISQERDRLRSLIESLEQRLRERAPVSRAGHPAAAAIGSANQPTEEAIGKLGEALERRTGELIALDRVTEALSSSLDLEVVLRRLLGEVRRLLETEGAAVILHESASDTLSVVAAEGAGTEALVGVRLPVVESLARPVLRKRRVLLVNDALNDPRYAQGFLELAGGRIHSALLVPLVCRGKVMGVLGTANRAVGEFDQSHVRVLSAIANIAAVAIENARLFGEVREGHERLQRLSRQLVEVQEAERRQIARELHDEIGQSLTGLKLVLDMGRSTASALERERLGEAQTLVKELLARVREMSLDLRPAMLDDLGLLPALLWHFDRFAAQTGIRVAFRHSGVEGRRFSSEVESAAYRVVQEALTNVARHAAVREATVRLWADDMMLGAWVEDQGKGFDLEPTLAAHGSTGLLGMRERAGLLGGHLTMESTPGAGSRVTVEFPLVRAGPSKETQG